MALLLQAAVAPAGTGAAAWEAWLAAGDFEAIEPGATELLGLVDRDLGAPPSVRQRVRGVYRRTWAGNRLVWSATTPLVGALATTVPPVLLGPGAVLASHGGDRGVRPIERLHLGLPVAAAPMARDALRSTGWAVEHVTPSLVARTEAGLVDRWQATDPSGRWVTLRWHVLRGISSAAADEQLLGASATATVEGVAVRTLHPGDALLERLWRAQDDRHADWIADAVHLARRAVGGVTGDGAGGTSGGASRFAARAASLRLTAEMRASLEVAHAAVPDDALAAARVALDGPAHGPDLRALPAPLGRLGRAVAG
ncbi:MAG TPA: hypothetical protein VHK88_17940, partial [Aquihabitans sp.]|nr:hypothetical protein [Aquihabitans sp.]